MNGLRIPINRLSPDGLLPHWLALGPFPNSMLDEPLADGTERGGLDTDYLKDIGDECTAHIQPDTRVTCPDKGFESVDLIARPREICPNGNLELATLYPGSQFHVAYACCHLESETDQPAYAYFGSKDGAKVWVNGILVHRVWSRRRAVRPWTECFEVRLRKGVNRILVKVENSGNEWAFVLQVYREADHLAAVGEHLRSLSLELENHVVPTRDPHIRLRARTLPSTLLPPVNVKFEAIDQDGLALCTAHNVTGRDLRLDLPAQSAGFVTLDAHLADAQLPLVQGRSLAYIGNLDDLRNRIARRLAALDLLTKPAPEGADAAAWLPAHRGLVDFARNWLRTGTGAVTDRDLQLLRDFESLAMALESGRNYLTEKLGRLHPLRCESSASEFAPEQYLLYLPKGYGEPGRKWPLVLFLSGAGAVGTDIQRLTQHDLIHRLVRDRDYPLPVVAPQCPAGKDWNAREPAHLDAFLDEVCSGLSIDPERIVLTGLSMGARAAWEWAAVRPDRFAAVIPVCGRLDPTIAPQIKDPPIWIWHGDCDGTVPIYYAELAVDALREEGSQVRISIIEGEGHDAWDHAYNDPELLRWMQSCRRPDSRRRAATAASSQLTDLSPTGFRTDEAIAWLCLRILCDGGELHRTLYLGLIRLYGLLRTRAGLTADRLGYALIGEIAASAGSRMELTLGLPMDTPPQSVEGLATGSLPRFAYAAGDYRGSVQGTQEAFAELSRWTEGQGKRPSGQRRLRVRYVNRDVDYLDAELQLGVDA